MEFKQFIKANDKYSTTAEPVNAPYIRKSFTLDGREYPQSQRSMQ